VKIPLYEPHRTDAKVLVMEKQKICRSENTCTS